jgi:hypothetical protein
LAKEGNLHEFNWAFFMESISLNDNNQTQPCGALVCEACGADFACGASLAGCWCTEVKLTDEARAELKSKYERCLCRNCLEAVSITAPAAMK